MMSKFMKKEIRPIWLLVFCIIFGVFLRYLVMTMGYNYDMVSYYIIGKLMDNGKNFYAITRRYNYAPFFCFIEWFCYSVTKTAGADGVTTAFHAAVVTFLVAGDVAITIMLYKKYSLVPAIMFILNPISIFITGYHSQFDNLAIMFMFAATFFFNKDSKVDKRDLLFIVLMSLSLIMKHVFFIMPFFILVVKDLPLNKKCMYAFIPPFLFLFSFIPFMVNNMDAVNGIVNNVFLYRSFSNYPLFYYWFDLLDIPTNFYFLIYMFIMCCVAIIIRKKDIEYIFLIYLIAMVAFSSAIANQYLVIPILALCVLNKKSCILYSVLGFYYLMGNADGLQLSYLPRIVQDYYGVEVWILFITLLLLVIKKHKKIAKWGR